MKLKTFLLIALALCICTDASAQARKKKMKEDVKTEKNLLQPVPADTFSYAMGVAQSESLKQFLMRQQGVTEANIPVAIQGMRDYSKLTEAQVNELIAYAAGVQIGMMNSKNVIPVLNQQATGSKDVVYADLSKFVDGLADGMSNTATMTAEEANAVGERQMEYHKEEMRIKNNRWLAVKAQEEGVERLKSGLCYRVLTPGKGAVATENSEVEVHYEGKLIDDTVFDSSYKRGQTATFRPTQVIKGWTEALQLMPEGSVWELYIPYFLAYGENGNQSIPPYSTLIFKVELVKVKSEPATK
jgi:FKBP-type peptidyl-prolyl cis-trans isomerase FklB